MDGEEGWRSTLLGPTVVGRRGKSKLPARRGHRQSGGARFSLRRRRSPMGGGKRRALESRGEADGTVPLLVEDAATFHRNRGAVSSRPVLQLRRSAALDRGGTEEPIRERGGQSSGGLSANSGRVRAGR